MNVAIRIWNHYPIPNILYLPLPCYNRLMPEHDAFWRTLYTRRSIRQYGDQSVPRSLLERLLTAAIWAPNAHNRQSWRFVAVTERSSQQQLADSMAQRWEHDLLADGLDSQKVRAQIERSRARIMGAGALVVGCLTMADMDHYADELSSAPGMANGCAEHEPCFGATAAGRTPRRVGSMLDVRAPFSFRISCRMFWPCPQIGSHRR